ncbi:MAG: carboxypeptidase-like regulatory domain-containing protein, partial [Bacteroidota bacterium]
MNRNLLWIWMLLLLPVSLWAQNPNVYQFSGLVISSSSNEPIPFARIQVNHTRRGAVSNSEGFYSIPVGLGDTLYFNHLGYHPSQMVVLDYLEQYQGDQSQYIYAINYMLEDSFAIDTVTIFPY